MNGIGVIGYGYWGPNLVRNFAEMRDWKLVALADQQSQRLERAKARYQWIKTYTDAKALIEDPDVAAVAIATPVSSHFPLARYALRAGKHVFVEKPLASSRVEAEELILEADRRRLVLMVDHTFVYTGAVRKIRQLVESGHLGELYYFDSVRVNLGLFQHDVNVIWDLAVHDVAIMDYVLDFKPSAVSASGLSHFRGQHQNISYITLFFDSRLIAHFHVNWLAPVKVRQVLIGGSKRMIVYNDLEPSEKIKIYDKGVTIGEEAISKILPDYRTGDMWAPQLDQTEALRTAATHFLDCINRAQQPITDGASGLRVVEILEAATESMVNRGRLISLSAGPRKEISVAP